jgi:acetoin utilization protein AcuB
VRIDKWMTRQVEKVKPLDSILHARELMERRRINQLPVVFRGEVVGMITDRDLRDAFPSVFADRKTINTLPDPAKIPVEQVMSANVVSLTPDDTVEKAAQIMLSERFGAIPIVNGTKLVGILARTDVLRAFALLCEALGLTKIPQPPAKSKTGPTPSRRQPRAPRSRSRR